jgi:hypothetical protein
MRRRGLGEYRIIGRRYHPNGTSTAIALWCENQPVTVVDLPLRPDAADHPLPTARIAPRRRRR